ncbi:MAG: hypothetical protein A2Z29_03430 [Chloroflexi bacterium RBG_16_56_11]|nr:MAG: hypothetical protein A2Z29_03430 [Chloroflexi bacterium RBG_16_56_11]
MASHQRFCQKGNQREKEYQVSREALLGEIRDLSTRVKILEGQVRVLVQAVMPGGVNLVGKFATRLVETNSRMTDLEDNLTGQRRF